MSHPNEDLLRQGYEDFAAGNLEAVLSIFADDIVIHGSGSSQISGEYRGHDGAMKLFEAIAKISDGTATFDIHDIVANDTHGVALLTTRAQRAGQSLDARQVHVWHIADGKLTETWNMSTDQAAIDAFYA
jgi:uncharacterized protein